MCFRVHHGSNDVQERVSVCVLESTTAVMMCRKVCVLESTTAVMMWRKVCVFESTTAVMMCNKVCFIVHHGSNDVQ